MTIYELTRAVLNKAWREVMDGHMSMSDYDRRCQHWSNWQMRTIERNLGYESRYFRACVRKTGAIGSWYMKTFCLDVALQGSHDKLMQEAIAGIHKSGYEVMSINSHASRKECL